MMNENHRSSELNTVVKVALLLGFAAFYIVSLLTGSVSLYVHPRMIPSMIFAAVVMVIIAAVYFIKYVDTGAKNNGLRPLLLFVAALVMAWVFPAQTFNAGTGTAGAPQLTAVDVGSGPQTDGSPAPTGAAAGTLETDDSADAESAPISAAGADGTAGTPGSGTLVFNDKNYYENLCGIYQDPDAYVGRDIELTGFVFKDSGTLHGDEFVAARLLMVCCAADMQTVGLLCRWPSAAGLEPDTWVRVTGTLGKAEFNGEYVPVIEAETVEEAAAPDIVYIYPF